MSQPHLYMPEPQLASPETMALAERMAAGMVKALQGVAPSEACKAVILASMAFLVSSAAAGHEGRMLRYAAAIMTQRAEGGA